LGFRVLGSLEVVVDGSRVVVERQRQRTFLSLLLLRGGEFVSIDWLSDELWAGEPPHAARASLQNSVCQLRKHLGPTALLTGTESYALDVDLGRLDSEQFRLAVSDSRRAAAPESRARMLRSALALWRGPAFADITKTRSLSFEASLLNELRVSAVEDAIDAELQLGRGAALVPELEQLIADEPYRERLRAQLMLALYRAGRQSTALEVFRAAQQTLLVELGLEPSPALRQLERAILNHEPDLLARSL
jgi:DNA-binding SARP family transcriptional activator